MDRLNVITEFYYDTCLASNRHENPPKYEYEDSNFMILSFKDSMRLRVVGRATLCSLFQENMNIDYPSFDAVTEDRRKGCYKGGEPEKV